MSRMNRILDPVQWIRTAHAMTVRVQMHDDPSTNIPRLKSGPSVVKVPEVVKSGEDGSVD